MIKFENIDQKYALEDQLFWMYKVTYEIEMHVNAILSLDKIISDMGLRSDQTLDMIFYHNELALLRTAFILKKKPKRDEKHSLFSLKDYLDGQKINTSIKPLKKIFERITAFYLLYQNDIDKLISKRDAKAHEFKIDRLIKENNDISFNKQLEITIIAREFIAELYFALYGADFPVELQYATDIYEKIYNASSHLIAPKIDN